MHTIKARAKVRDEEERKKKEEEEEEEAMCKLRKLQRGEKEICHHICRPGTCRYICLFDLFSLLIHTRDICVCVCVCVNRE